MAEIKVSSVEKTKTFTFQEKQVTLTLSESEAKSLSLVLSKVGGQPDTTPRKYIDNIANQLNKNGFYYHDIINKIYGSIDDVWDSNIKGSSWFKSNTLKLVE